MGGGAGSGVGVEGGGLPDAGLHGADRQVLGGGARGGVAGSTLLQHHEAPSPVVTAAAKTRHHDEDDDEPVDKHRNERLPPTFQLKA